VKELKVCLVSLTFAPDSQDGSAKFFTGIFNYLKKQGHEVKVITGKWNKVLDHPDITQVNLIRKSYFWAPQFTAKALKYFRGRTFDIIHGNGPKGSIPLFLFKKSQYITTIHDLGPYEMKPPKIPVERFLIKQVVKNAICTTTCSETIKKELKFYVPEINMNKIFNLYSAIEDKYKPYPKEAQKLRAKLGIEGPILLYIGRIAHYKGVSDIITAYKIAKKKIPDINLVMGGTPDFSMNKIYQEWKRKYKDIYFVGFVAEKEIPLYYSMGDIFITYSYASEGFGLTPIEAIACGTPVICSSLKAYQEVLQDNAIFVPPRNPRQLAEEIIALLKDDDKRNNMIKKAQLFIQRYSWNAVGKKLEQIYWKILTD